MTHAHDREALDPAVRPVARRAEQDHAWQVARRVVANGSSRGAEPHSLLRLQRLAGNGGVGSLVGGEEDAQSPVLDVVGRGGGSALPASVRTEMEQGLGADFSSVRVHTDGAAVASAQAVQAKAYTVGDEIVFNRGAYEPDSDAGRHTLAHELTHVVQQRSGPVEGTPTGDGVAISDPGDRFEQAAEASATALMSGSAPTTASGAPAVQRDGDDHDEAPPVQREDDEEMLQEIPLQREEPEEEELAG
jgi:Domain of unknown function (DUF4157)